MTRVHPLSCVIVLLATRPSTADVERIADLTQTMISVAGTTWLADDGPLGAVTYYFERGGKLVYTYANGTEYRNGTWEQRGDVLYFEANQRYRECRAKVRGRVISGPSWNQAGLKWETTLRFSRAGK